MKKEKRGTLSLRFALMLFGMIPIIVTALTLGIVAVKVSQNLVMEEIEEELKTSCTVAEKHLVQVATKQGGVWSYHADRVYTGSIPLNPDDTFFESGLIGDVHFTFFWGDTRYATSIKDESGNPIVGTKASDAVITHVLQNGEEFFIPHVDIVGQDFSGYYVPIRDNSENIIGMMFAGKSQADVKKELTRVVLIVVIASVIIAVVIGLLVIAFSSTILKRVAIIRTIVERMKGGDFVTQTKNDNSIKDFYELADDLEVMRRDLNGALHEVKVQAGNVTNGAENTKAKISESQRTTGGITQAVNDLANGATMMAQDVQSTSDLTINIGNSVDEVLGAADNNLNLGRQVYENSKEVQKQLEELKAADEKTDEMAGQVADSVNTTAHVVQEISKAAEAIINIASQTNLLALNASIEAARAGEAGKGFAVVADNIKGLAEESNKAASEITGMLSTITDLSNKNKELTASIKEATSNESVALEQMMKSFDEMQQQLIQTEEGNQRIANLVETMTTDKDSIMNSVESLSSVSEENAASTQETSASLLQLDENMVDVVGQAEDLQQVAVDLLEQVKFFRTEEDEVI